MAPVDYVRSISAPDAYSNDVYLPVDQLSILAQLRPDVSLSAFYQFVWRGSRLPGVGSYFSTTNALGVGADRLFFGAGNFPAFRAGRGRFLISGRLPCFGPGYSYG